MVFPYPILDSFFNNVKILESLNSEINGIDTDHRKVAGQIMSHLPILEPAIDSILD